MYINKFKVEMILAKKELSRKDLARAYGVTTNRISMILNSKAVRTSTAVKLASVLGVDVTEIIED